MNITEPLPYGRIRTVRTHFPFPFANLEVVDEVRQTSGYSQFIVRCKRDAQTLTAEKCSFEEFAPGMSAQKAISLMMEIQFMKLLFSSVIP